MASPQTRNLKTANGGKVAPQHYNDAMGDFEYSKGSDGALHTKVINQPSVTLVDKNGNPIDGGNKLPVDVTFPAEQAVKDADVLAKLAEIEAKIQATNDRLNQTLNTQLTGSLPADYCGKILYSSTSQALGAGMTFNTGRLDIRNYNFIVIIVRINQIFDVGYAVSPLSAGFPTSGQTWWKTAQSATFPGAKFYPASLNISDTSALEIVSAPYLEVLLRNNAQSDATLDIWVVGKR